MASFWDDGSNAVTLFIPLNFTQQWGSIRVLISTKCSTCTLQMAMKCADLGHLASSSPCNPCATHCNCAQMAMKCADLGHLASAKSVHLKWVHALEEEMFRQGDLEKQRGYPVSPLMDRTKTGITKSQTGVRGAAACHEAEFSLWRKMFKWRQGGKSPLLFVLGL